MEIWLWFFVATALLFGVANFIIQMNDTTSWIIFHDDVNDLRRDYQELKERLDKLENINK